MIRFFLSPEALAELAWLLQQARAILVGSDRGGRPAIWLVDGKDATLVTLAVGGRDVPLLVGGPDREGGVRCPFPLRGPGEAFLRTLARGLLGYLDRPGRYPVCLLEHAAGAGAAETLGPPGGGVGPGGSSLWLCEPVSPAARTVGGSEGSPSPGGRPS